MIYYITGGERSGKSKYAQNLALNLSEFPTYIATARVWDKDFSKRVECHENDRNNHWTTIESEKEIARHLEDKKTYVMDCVTLWLTNFYVDTKNDIETCLELAKKEIDLIQKADATTIIISNEIGMGLHAQTEVGRKFTELQGWVNQYIAERADKATFMVSGLPLILK